MKDVKHTYYVVAMIDENDPDDCYYVGVDPYAGGLFSAVYITTDIEDAAKVCDATMALNLAEAANEQFSHFGRPYIASTAVSVKWTAV